LELSAVSKNNKADRWQLMAIGKQGEVGDVLHVVFATVAEMTAALMPCRGSTVREVLITRCRSS
jgi:hypothetical protein